jgi:hypothetical protein
MYDSGEEVQLPLGNSATDMDSDYASATNEDMFYSFKPRPKEGWICGGLSGLVTITRCVVKPHKYPRGNMMVSVFLDESNAIKNEEIYHSSFDCQHPLSARLGYTNRLLCENSLPCFATFMANSGRAFSDPNVFRYLTHETLRIELPRLRDINRHILWGLIIDNRYNTNLAYNAIIKIQSVVRMRLACRALWQEETERGVIDSKLVHHGTESRVHVSHSLGRAPSFASSFRMQLLLNNSKKPVNIVKPSQLRDNVAVTKKESWMEYLLNSVKSVKLS